MGIEKAEVKALKNGSRATGKMNKEVPSIKKRKEDTETENTKTSSENERDTFSMPSGNVDLSGLS